MDSITFAMCVNLIVCHKILQIFCKCAKFYHLFIDVVGCVHNMACLHSKVLESSHNEGASGRMWTVHTTTGLQRDECQVSGIDIDMKLDDPSTSICEKNMTNILLPKKTVWMFQRCTLVRCRLCLKARQDTSS